MVGRKIIEKKEMFTKWPNVHIDIKTDFIVDQSYNIAKCKFNEFRTIETALQKNPLLNCEINYKRLTIFGLGKIVVVLKSNLLSIAVSLECIEVVLCSKLLKSIRSRFPK